MTVSTLKEELIKLGIPSQSYSINGNLISDTHFLNSVYGNWEYFYFDERGVRRENRKFIDEEDACDYLLRKLKSIYVNECAVCETNDDSDKRKPEVIYL